MLPCFRKRRAALSRARSCSPWDILHKCGIVSPDTVYDVMEMLKCHTKREITDIKESIQNRLKSEHVKYGNNNRIQFTSVQDGIYVLGNTYMCSTPYLRSFPNAAFEMVPMFVWLTMALSRPFKETGSEHTKGSKELFIRTKHVLCFGALS